MIKLYLQMAEVNDCQTRILVWLEWKSKVLFKNEGEIKTFLDKQKLR